LGGEECGNIAGETHLDAGFRQRFEDDVGKGGPLAERPVTASIFFSSTRQCGRRR